MFGYKTNGAIIFDIATNKKMALDTNKWSKASLDTKQMKKGQGWIQNKARGKFGYKTNEALGVCCDTNTMASGHSYL